MKNLTRSLINTITIIAVLLMSAMSTTVVYAIQPRQMVLLLIIPKRVNKNLKYTLAMILRMRKVLLYLKSWSRSRKEPSWSSLMKMV
jgi:hypothetical protein